MTTTYGPSNDRISAAEWRLAAQQARIALHTDHAAKAEAEEGTDARDEAVMRALMQNIIANGGTFVP